MGVLRTVWIGGEVYFAGTSEVLLSAEDDTMNRALNGMPGHGKFRQEPLFLELQAARVFLAAGAFGQGAIKLRTAGFQECLADARSNERAIKVRDHHIVARFRSLSQDAAVRINDHRIARANLVVINAYAVAEDQKNAVVVRAAGKPSHQPATAFWAEELALDGFGVLRALVPQAAVDQSHQVRIMSAAAARLMRSKKDFGPGKRGDAHVFDQVVVITGKDARPEPVRRIKNGVLTAARNVFADKRVELAVSPRRPVGHRHDIRVVHRAAVGNFNQPGADRHSVFFRESHQCLRRRAVEDRLGKPDEFLSGKMAQKPVPGDAALGKRDQVHALASCTHDKIADLGEVRSLVAGGVFKLDGSGTDFPHGTQSFDVNFLSSEDAVPDYIAEGACRRLPGKTCCNSVHAV